MRRLGDEFEVFARPERLSVVDQQDVAGFQPLFVGIVLLGAVSLGSLRLLRIKNKLDLYR